LGVSVVVFTVPRPNRHGPLPCTGVLIEAVFQPIDFFFDLFSKLW